MKATTFLTILAFLALASFTAASFDYFMFVQRWPGGVCATSRCNAGAKRFPYWVIHGLWPQNNDGTWPSFCGGKYNSTLTKDLIDPLEAVWPDLQRDDEQGFWKHEYEKHGTCSVSTYIKNQHDYFAQSIKLQAQVNLLNILNAAGITPGRTYETSVVFEAMQSVTGTQPQLYCIGNNLVELRVCFDKNLRYTNCDQHGANCKANLTLANPPR